MSLSIPRSRFLAGVAALLAAACLAPAATAQTPAPPAGDARLAAAFDAILERQLKELHIPGGALAVVQDGRVVYARAAGLRDIERNLPATLDTVFPIGSATKAFTAVGVVIDQDQGLLSLDDHPRRFLPDFRMVDPEADAKVTLRHMLSHRTGLRAYADLAAEPGVLTAAEYVRAGVGAQPAYPFDTRFQYSNVMIAAAGEVLGSIDHASWDQVMARRIFAPLGMSSAVASLESLPAIPDHATGYVYDPASGAWQATPAPVSLRATAAAGAIAASTRDMIRWVTMLAEGGELEGRRLVSKAGFAEMIAPQIAIDERRSYALGWATYDLAGLNVVEHNGGSRGISALVSFIPERRVGFVFLANTSPNRMTQVAGEAGQLLYPLLLGLPAEAAAPPPAAAKPTPAAATPAVAGAPLPAVDVLLARMVAAAGGETALRRHATLSMHGEKSYDNQGVTADFRVAAKAPAARVEEEVWTAAGREIGRVRAYFDGAAGGQETTFGQDEINDAAANAAARRAWDFHFLADLRALYPDLAVEGRSEVGGEPAYVLRLGAPGADPVRLHVGERTGRLLKREAGAETTEYDDFRTVDGVVLPFRTVLHDALGVTTTRFDQVRFDAPVTEGAFSPRSAR